MLVYYELFTDMYSYHSGKASEEVASCLENQMSRSRTLVGMIYGNKLFPELNLGLGPRLRGDDKNTPLGITGHNLILQVC